MAEPTKEQLQAEIMEILYQKSIQKPVWVSCTEIFWNIKNVKVKERSVKEILDWLVKNELVLYQADKYQIDKREFIDMEKRKSMDTKEMESTDDEPGVIIDDPLQNVKDYQSPIHDIPVVHHSKNAVYTVVALVTFLFCGTLVGTLLFNSFAMEETPKTEISSIPDSISVNQLQIVPPVYSHETYHINRNFRRIYNTLEAQQKINMELTELTKKQQIQISTLAAYVNLQTSEIERYEREHNIYKWMTSIALLLLSSLLLYLHLRKS